MQVKGRSVGTVEDLRKDVHKWCGVPTEDQRFHKEGLPLLWEVNLNCAGEGTTLEVTSSRKVEEERKLVFPVQDGRRGYRTFEAQDGDTMANLTSEVAI